MDDGKTCRQVNIDPDVSALHGEIDRLYGWARMELLVIHFMEDIVRDLFLHPWIIFL